MPILSKFPKFNMINYQQKQNWVALIINANNAPGKRAEIVQLIEYTLIFQS